MLKELFVEYIRDGIIKNWEIPALSDYQGESFTYAEVAAHIVNIHQLYKKAGIKKGDKVALVGRNSAKWCIVYLATVTYGAVIVPILPDFKPADITELVNHSDSLIFFCYDSIFETIDPAKLPALKGIISVNSYTLLFAADPDFQKIVKEVDPAKPAKIKPEDFNPPSIANNEIAVISYTSGTTGHSKGVVLSHNSLAANIRYAQKSMPLNPGDPIVSFLPLAHTYGCAFEFLFPFTIGCTVTILTKSPTPQIVLQAFKEIKPALILSVPLVIEKIYKKQLIPVISKPLMKVLLAIPGINLVLRSKIRKKLTDSFGGNFREIVIGGAAFNPEAESFFRKIKFPSTVGYGMTECGPLISYAPSSVTRLGSSGIAVDTLEVKIDSLDPAKIIGEIILRGENVMLGYYKNKQATDEIIDKDGWLHTGDLVVIDKDGFIYIKGRSKCMILGSSGKNIYPEEIEASFNNKYLIMESVVVQRDEKLVALIYPDSELKEKDHVSDEKLMEILKHHLHDVNNSMPKYMQVSRFELVNEEFAKTPKRSIKRFLYE
jgi:long-chain acyl-CoA synthetase